MVLTTTEVITVDGVNMKNLARNIETLGATLRRASSRGANAPVASRAGRLWTPGKLRDEVVYNWPMWVVGADEDDLIPGGSTDRKEFFKRVDELIALFSKRDRLLDIRHTLADGSIRQMMCESVSVLDFTTQGASPFAMVSVELVNPSGAAQDTADIVQSILTTASLPITLDYTSFAGATEIMDDLVIAVTGPVTNVRLEAYRAGAALGVPVWVQYNGAITGGQVLTINGITGAVSGSGGLSPLLSNVVWSGTARFFHMVPRDALADPPQVRVTGTGASAATAVQITGRRKYGTG